MICAADFSPLGGTRQITTTDKTFVSEFNGKDVVSYDIDPEELLKLGDRIQVPMDDR